jgi:accessory colonization factor AcfC
VLNLQLPINIEGNLSITANFEPLIDSYELILVTTGGGNVSGAGVYNDGTEVEILATAK